MSRHQKNELFAELLAFTVTVDPKGEETVRASTLKSLMTSPETSQSLRLMLLLKEANKAALAEKDPRTALIFLALGITIGYQFSLAFDDDQARLTERLDHMMKWVHQKTEMHERAGTTP